MCALLTYFSANPEEVYAKKHITERDKQVIELAHSVDNCIDQKDTNYPVFHGCIDWHSSVHAHWAIIRTYRFTNDEYFLARALSLLDADKMQHEFIKIKSNDYFEMPYGRSWFLKLMVEYEKVTGENKFRYFSDYIAESLYEYILNKDFNPNEREYQNTSWAISNLYQYFKFTNDNEKIKSLKSHIKNYHSFELNLALDELNNDFFSLWGNFSYMLSYLLDSKEYKKWINKQSIHEAYFQPISHINSNHHLGINYSRAWGFWRAYEVTGEEEYNEAYISSIKTGFSLHERYKNNYHAYSHWVPQFGILALTVPYYE